MALSSEATTPPRRAMHEERGQMTASRRDRQILQRVLDVLCQDPRIDATRLAVLVGKGVVHLRGTVPTAEQKHLVEQEARRTPGVVEVIDEIVVAPSSPRPDRAIAVGVRGVLDSDPSLYAGGIVVGVTNGVVYLEGTVPSEEQIQQACDDAREVEGVVGIVCHLTVSV
jgi:osmotically-inducible protein OsmY